MVTIDDLRDYVARNVEDFDDRRRAALSTIDRRRVPLSVADYELHTDIVNAVEDFCDENEIAVDFFDDVNTDELL